MRRAVLAAGAAAVTLAAVSAGAGDAGLVPGAGPKAAAWAGVSLAIVFAGTLLAAMGMVLRGADLMRTAGQDQQEDGR